jgi:hypothetical protein
MLTISVLLLAACGNSSFKTESKETITAVKEAFNQKVKKPNKKSGNISFYMPFGFEIKEESPHNIIIKNGSKTYILFNNPQEDVMSEVVYQSTITQYKDIDVNEQFKEKDRFGYLIIKELKDGMNEMTIGVGGSKITTQVKTSSLKNEAAAMTQMVLSVENNK